MNKYLLFGIVGFIILFALYATFQKDIVHSIYQSQNVQKEKRLTGGPYKYAVFAGGCFWSMESYFEKIPEGVVEVVSGYSGGTIDNPTYENYVENGHREAVEVTYDPQKISYGELTEYFLRHIDPTDTGGSFFDRGHGYTSAIYYENESEMKTAKEITGIIINQNIFKKPIVTEILPLAKFWPAEEYHQNYASENSAHYTAYRLASGRDAFLKKSWEGKESPLYKNVTPVISPTSPK